MRVEVEMCGDRAASALAERRLRFVLARFAAALVSVALRAVEDGRGRVRLGARVELVDGDVVSAAADDEASDAATRHFIDRVGRAVARRLAGAGGRHA